MTIPPITLSGTNSNRLEPVLQYIYDVSISGYRSVQASDYSSGNSAGGNSSGVPLPVPTGAATATFVQFNAPLVSGANIAHRITGSTTYCQGIEFYNPNNTGTLQVGTAQRQLRGLGYGEPISYSAPQGKQLNLADFAFSGSVSGQNLVVTLFN
jgi:hypothetical protein